MISPELLYSIIANPFLLALQRWFVAPIVRRLPAKRYSEYRLKRNVLFKITCFSAERLVIDYAKDGNSELSLRFACELVANQGYAFYSQQWQPHILYVGLLRAAQRDYDQASIWLAAGVEKQHRRLFDGARICSYPEDFVAWLTNNDEDLTSVAGWQSLFERTAGNQHESERVLVYIAALVFLAGLKNAALIFLDSVALDGYSDWKKMLAHRGELPSRFRLAFNDQEIRDGTYHNVEQKLAVNLTHAIFSGDSAGGALLDGVASELKDSADYQCVNHELFSPLTMAFRHISRGHFQPALEVLSPVVASRASHINSLRERCGPKKIFIAGYGWSGSSAVHDALRGYPDTENMPGAGLVPLLNIGADSEPTLHQGPASIYNMIDKFDAKAGIPPAILKMFFKNYVLLLSSFDYAEYKLVHANRQIIEKLGFDGHYLLICAFLHQYASAMLVHKAADAIAAIENYYASIVNSIYGDNERVFFNNSIYAHRSGVLQHIKGPSYYVIVNRNMGDQYCDQMRSNKFFNARFLEFYLVKYVRKRKFRLAKRSVKNQSVAFFEIDFERWVKDKEFRRLTTTRILGAYDERLESRYFDPLESAKNIDISRGNLGTFDALLLKLLENIGMSI